MKIKLMTIITLAFAAFGAAAHENLATGGTASYSGAVRHTGASSESALFDNDPSTYYGFGNATGTLSIVYTLPCAVTVNGYGIQCGPSTYWSATTRAPNTFQFEGRNSDDEEWVTLDSRAGESGWTNSELRVYKFENSSAYYQYRLLQQKPTGYTGFAELQFYYIDSSDRLIVASDGLELGTPDPAYGTHDGQSVGATVTCTMTAADVILGSDGERYVFAGYDLYGKADTKTPELLGGGKEKSVSYTQTTCTEVLWKWERAPMYAAVDGDDQNDGWLPSAAKTLAGALSAATAGQVILLKDGDYSLTAALSITKAVTLKPVNAGKALLYGAGTHSLMTLNNASATMEGLVFSNGYATCGEDLKVLASGVLVTAGTLKDCVVRNCRGENYGCPAVYLNGSGARMIGGAISNNVSRMTNSNNRYYILRTAGLVLSSGTAEGVLIADNRGGSGVAVYQTGGTVTDCSILRNVGSSEQTGEPATALGTEACAWGTVFMSAGTMTGCRIADNVAASAAGAYLIGSATMSDCTVANNRATLDYPLGIAQNNMLRSGNQPDVCHRRPIGGIVLGASGATVTGCTIVSNRADTCGSDQGLYVIAGTATDNVFEANGEDVNTSKSISFVAYAVPDDGETGTWPYSTPETAARSVQDAVDAVAATRGQPGTVYVAAGDYATADNEKALVVKRPVRIVGPQEGVARLTGGLVAGRYGLWLADKDARVERLTLEGFFPNSTQTQVTEFMWAGAIVYTGTMAESVVTNTTQYSYGGASAVVLLGGTVTNCTIVGNNRQNVNGGVQHRGTVRIYGGELVDSRLAANKASNGGGVFVAGADARVRRCRIEGNYATGYLAGSYLCNPGAGVYLQAAGVVENCLIAGNASQNYSKDSTLLTGAGAYQAAGTIRNCTIADNRNSNDALVSGLVADGGTLENTIVWRNGSVNFSTNTAVAVVTSLLDADPKFRDRGKCPYALTSASTACLGTGTLGAWTSADRDLAGNPRVRADKVDLGCYEAQRHGLMLLVR